MNNGSKTQVAYIHLKCCLETAETNWGLTCLEVAYWSWLVHSLPGGRLLLLPHVKPQSPGLCDSLGMEAGRVHIYRPPKCNFFHWRLVYFLSYFHKLEPFWPSDQAWSHFKQDPLYFQIACVVKVSLSTTCDCEVSLKVWSTRRGLRFHSRYMRQINDIKMRCKILETFCLDF